MKKTKIGIIGHGYVGKSIEHFFSGIYDLFIFDIKNIETRTIRYGDVLTTYTSKNGILTCDFIFICVPTPEKKDGNCDTYAVESILVDLNKNSYKGTIIIKSTVPPSILEKNIVEFFNLKIVFSPEFAGENKYLTEHKFLQDIKASPFFIFGGDPEDTAKAVDLFQSIGGPEKKYIQTTIKLASLMKYLNNSFFALKVAFCNEIYDLCETLNVDYRALRELWLNDPRNSPDFTCVFSDNRGFGGKCFPKDSSALFQFAKSKGVDLSILGAAIKSNKKIRKQNGNE